MRRLALTAVLLLLAALALPRPAVAEPPALRRELWAVDVKVNADLTYSETIEQEYSFPAKAGIRLADRDYVPFYPESQSLELVEAYVIQPDGTRIPVPEAARFTRPSHAAQDTPGFTGSETTTVLFPQLREGSRTHVVWRLSQRRPSVLGFNLAVRPLLEWPTTHMRVRIDAPAELALRWGERGGFVVTDRVADGRRVIEARIDDVAAEEPERDMVASSDFLPVFAATTLASAEALGAIYHRQSAQKAVVTPEIAAAAARIAGDRTGLEAARAIHDWIASNIRYVAVYLDPNDGWVPHSAADVLAAGYGDCKDHVVLMQALLAARGIRSEAALVDLGDAYRPLPLWVPGQFNHAILHLSAWDRYLNPTNPFATFDSAERRLAGKQVVLATEHGGVAATRPRDPAQDRYQLDSEMTLSEDGTVRGIAHIAFSPTIDSHARRMVAEALSPGELTSRLLGDTPEGGYGTLASTDPRDLEHPFAIEARWVSPHGVPLDNGEGFAPVPVGVDLEPVAQLRGMLNQAHPPRHDFTAGALDFTWRTVLKLPAGLAVLSLPPDVAVHNAAGSYTAAYERIPDGLRVTRHLVIARDGFPAAAYPEFEALIYAPLDDARRVIGFGPSSARNSVALQAGGWTGGEAPVQPVHASSPGAAAPSPGPAF
jgi:transglutaminase-like putative cysteine protease